MEGIHPGEAIWPSRRAEDVVQVNFPLQNHCFFPHIELVVSLKVARIAVGEDLLNNFMHTSNLGRKKRNQYVVLFFSIFSVVCGLTLLAVGCANGSLGIVTGLTLFLVLGAVGGLLFVLYLRAIGRCNLPWWPSRAARISRTLIPSGPPEEELNSVPASATQLTLAEPVQGGAGGNERSKLMEEPDTLEADKIAESEPKIVLQMPVDASSKTA